MKACSWCRQLLEATVRRDAVFCSRKCRQAAWRVRRYSSPVDGRQMKATSVASVVSGRPLRFAYADPPYPGTAKRYYQNEPTYKGEVDHAKLIASLRASATYAGWALSTSARALRDVLPLCPPEARVCAWVKPHSVPPATYGLHNVWEPIIVLQGRRLQPGRVDALIAYPARFGGTLPGRKPLVFCAWLFHAMGMLPGDVLDDLYPGSGIVSRAWREVSGRSHDYGSLRSAGSSGAVAARSRRAGRDGSTIAGNDG